MKKMIFAIILAAWPLFLPAQTPYAGPSMRPISPYGATTTMRSTSSYSAMTTTMHAPTVYEPFTTSSPSEATLASDPSYAPGRHLRKTDGDAPPTTTGGTGGDPTITPPVGDALLPLFLLAFCYLCYLAVRARKRCKQTLRAL